MIRDERTVLARTETGSPRHLRVGTRALDYGDALVVDAGAVSSMPRDADATNAPVISERVRNRTLLARQHLLERSSQPMTKVLDNIAGIQARYAPSMYVGLWSRIAGFEPSGPDERARRT